MRWYVTLVTLMFSALVGSVAVADAAWSKAGDCFNAGDFDCAYDAAMELFHADKIVVGSDHRTTDSMTFFQMAYMEKAARVSPVEAALMAGGVITDFGTVRTRLPFLWGFVIMAGHESCGDSKECAEGFMHLFCRVKDEIPPPSWRKLNNTNDLSETGRKYFERVMRFNPECTGA